MYIHVLMSVIVVIPWIMSSLLNDFFKVIQEGKGVLVF